MRYQYIFVSILSAHVSIGLSNCTSRKHKVHNIVLYPDKHSWCTSTPIKQVVSDVDCDSVEIDNRVCLGACFSYSIPKTLSANNADEINSYCDSCQPVKTSWIPVKLSCNDGSNHTKHVQLIAECRCSSCNRHWEYENPLINNMNEDATVEISTQTSRYLELMKLEHDENGEDEETDIPGKSNIEILQDVVNSTRIVYGKNVWIRGPHHSKVLLRREMAGVPIIDNDDGRHHYLQAEEDVTTGAEKNNLP